MGKISRMIANVLCGVLVVGAVVGAGTALYMGGKNNGWFDELKKPNTEQTQPDNNENEVADGMVIPAETTAKTMRVTAKTMSASADENDGIAAYADNSYTLTATITPSNADNKAVDWSVAWNNPSSPWASGKTVTDYVKVSPTTDGALTARVDCKKAFGEKVKITVTSRDNESVTADCICDYTKKIVSVSGYVGPASSFAVAGTGIPVDTTKSQITYSIPSTSFSAKVASAYLKSSYQYSDYTIDDTFICSLKFQYTPQYAPAIGGVAGAVTLTAETSGSNSSCVISSSNTNNTMQFGKWFLLVGSEYGYFENATMLNQAVDHLKTATDRRFAMCNVTLTGRHSTFTKTIYYTVDTDSLVRSVTGVSTNSSLIF